jgi:hypothetical protein
MASPRRWWLVWRGTRVVLVRARLASEARAEAAPMFHRGLRRPAYDAHARLVVRRASRADVAAYLAAQAQAKAGAAACRVA